ncbi:MAG: tRNA 2-selenouridine(34) synthase MnmH [Syntrophomonadaceae bacterium]|nr:tRNA 2-selenouridine(34) synthase MnmH [Syntrophomonadaceae bacterium]
MPKEISFLEISELNPVLIDVRSGREYLADHIPGAFNVPLLNDLERAEVGIVYKQHGASKAKMLALNMVSPKLPEMIETIKGLADGKPVVVYCWRGGLRSYSIASVLSIMGISVFRLEGGYKKFRKQVTQFFEDSVNNVLVVNIHGLAGTGKTEVIRELINLRAPAVDLERLADHRGSVFGHIGLTSQPTQKAFETRLFYALANLTRASCCILECESRRIGKLLLPITLQKAMQSGKNILIYDTLENRARRLVEEYTRSGLETLAQTHQALAGLKDRLGIAKVKSIQNMIQQGNLVEAAKLLLTDYYDPLYKYPNQPSPDYELCINNCNAEETARIICHHLKITLKNN